MGAPQIYDPIIHTQSVAASVWNIPHNQARTVNVVFYDTVGKKIRPRELEVDLDNYRGSFFKAGVPFAIAGKAIIS